MLRPPVARLRPLQCYRREQDAAPRLRTGELFLLNFFLHATGRVPIKGSTPQPPRQSDSPLDREKMCRELCRNRPIPASIGWRQVVSLAMRRTRADCEQTSVKTGYMYRSSLFGIISLLLGQRIDTEEVDGSSPFGPTISSSVQLSPLSSINFIQAKAVQRRKLFNVIPQRGSKSHTNSQLSHEWSAHRCSRTEEVA